MSRDVFKFGLIGILLIALIVSFIYSRQKSIVALLSTYHLLPEPEKLTELYFSDHLNLPQKTGINVDLPVAFTVHNLEYQPMTYTYQIKEIIELNQDSPLDATPSSDVSQPVETVIKQGKISLNHDEIKNVTETISSGETVGRMKVEVTLVEKEQSIHYWVQVE